MALSKYKIGQLIKVVDERNSYGITEFYGINIYKEFMPTVADTNGLDESKYKVVRKNRFVFSGMQTGRDECIRISLYNKDTPIIISPAYTTFEISEPNIVLPIYFFMVFLSKEKDRLGWFYSDGSVRSNLDWDRFCDIELALPDISTQQKYVDIYNSMVANQQSYERGLEDLMVVCDGYIEELRCKSHYERIGDYLELVSIPNENLQYGIADVKGISIEKKFINTKANMEGVNLASYILIQPNDFAYVTVTSRNGGKISVALNDSYNTYLCSSTYIVFRSKDSDKLLPQYLMLWFSRSEFNRYARFNSWGSARETFDWEDMCNVQIPIPDIKIQKAIVDIYKVYNTRRDINEQLKAQIKDICPILIRGSLEEGVKCNV